MADLTPEQLRELLPTQEELCYRPGFLRRDDEGLTVRVGTVIAGHLDRIASARSEPRHIRRWSQGVL